MKRKISKLIALLLVAVLIVSLTACGGGSNTSTSAKEPANTSKDESAASETGGEGETGETGEAGDLGITYDGPEVTITYWHTHSDSEAAVLKEQIIPEFEKQFPNIHVDAVIMPYDGLKQQVIQGVASGTAPDLMRMDIIWVPEFAEMGALVAMDDLPGFSELKDTLFEGPLSTNYFGGKYYGVPLNTNCLGGIWSKKMLDQLNLTEPPKTYDEIIALKDQLQEGQYFLAVDGTNTWSLAPLFYSLGGRYTDDEYTVASGYLDSDASIKALETIVQWNDEGIIGPCILGGKPDSSNGLFDGEYLVGYQGPWFFTNNTEEDIATVQGGLLPAGESGSNSVVGGEDLVMFSSGKNHDAAWVFARFLMSDFAQTAQALGGGHLIPTVKDVANSDEVMAVENMDIYVEQLNGAISRTPHPVWEKMSDQIGKLFESCVRHEDEPRAALEKLAPEIDALLAGEE